MSLIKSQVHVTSPISHINYFTSSFKCPSREAVSKLFLILDPHNNIVSMSDLDRIVNLDMWYVLEHDMITLSLYTGLQKHVQSEIRFTLQTVQVINTLAQIERRCTFPSLSYGL